MGKLNGIDNLSEELHAKEVCFISGSNRSGTTLLSNLLSAHPKTISCPESSFIQSQRQFLKRKKSWKEKDIRYVLKYLWIRKRPMKSVWRQDFDLLNEALNANKDNLTPAAYAKLIYGEYGGYENLKDISLFLDKNPGYVWILDDLSKLFPNAKFLFIVRDYRDRLSSFKKLKKFGVISAFLFRGVNWINHQQKIQAFCSKRQNALIIKYEELVSDPEVVLKSVCSFLKIDFDAKMLSHSSFMNMEFNEASLKEDSRLDVDHFKKMHEASVEPVNKDSIGQYRKLLSEQEIAQLEYVCSELGEQYGYQRVASFKIGPLTKVKLRLFQGLGKIIPLINKGFSRFPLSLQYWLISFSRTLLLKKKN